MVATITASCRVSRLRGFITRASIVAALLALIPLRPAAADILIPGVSTPDNFIAGNELDHHTAYEILQFLEEYTPAGTDMVFKLPKRVYKGKRETSAVEVEVQNLDQELIDKRSWDVATPFTRDQDTKGPERVARGIALLFAMTKHGDSMHATIRTPDSPVRATWNRTDDEPDTRIEQFLRTLEPRPTLARAQGGDDDQTARVEKPGTFSEYQVHLFKGTHLTHSGTAVYHQPEGGKESRTRDQLEVRPPWTTRFSKWIKGRVKRAH